MACMCGHSRYQHAEVGCMALDDDNKICPCPYYEDAGPDQPDEDSYPERER